MIYKLIHFQIYNSLDGTKCNTKDTTTALCVNQMESLEDESELLKVEPDERHILNFWFYNYTQYGNNLLFKADTYRSFFGMVVFLRKENSHCWTELTKVQLFM